ncbi:hypothetical protein [Streptomyces sp. NPDC005093]
MGDGLSRDERGLLPCAWCGGRIEQGPIGRLRDYCRRTCREMAYRERVTQRRIDEALALAGVPAVAVSSDSSVDDPWFGRVVFDETHLVHGETCTDTE